MTETAQTTNLDRHGVPIGSWWSFCPEGWPQAILRVESWSYWGRDAGNLNLVPYFQLFGHTANEKSLENIQELCREIEQLSVAQFWQYVDEGKIVRL